MTVTRWRSTFADLRSLRAVLIVRHRAGRDVHDDLVSRYCCSGDLQTVEYEVRCAREQFGVFVAEWLALGPVADHHRFAPGDRCDLAAGGEAGAAAPGQPGPVEHGHQRRSGRFGQRAEPLLVFGQARAVRREQTCRRRFRACRRDVVMGASDVRVPAYSV